MNCHGENIISHNSHFIFSFHIPISHSHFTLRISYFTFYVSLLFVVLLKLKINIFSKAQLKVVALLAGLLLLNYGWVKGVAPLFMRLPFSVKVNALVDAGVKSAVLMAVALVSCYYWHISEEVNQLIRKALRVKC